MLKMKKYEYEQSLQRLKKEQACNEILNSDNKHKTVWKIVNENRGKNKVNVDQCSVSPGNFNYYFTKVAENILENIPPLKKNYQGYLQNFKIENGDSFFFHPATEHEISHIIRNLKHSKSTGIYIITLSVCSKTI